MRLPSVSLTSLSVIAFLISPQTLTELEFKTMTMPRVNIPISFDR